MHLAHSSRGVLSQILRNGGVELHLSSDSRDHVFQELIERVPCLQRSPDVKRNLLGALLERERLCSTGLGDGVALPHTRNSIPGLANNPVLVFGRHEHGLNYGAVDGAPVHLLFLLVAPTVSLHLQILARLTRAIRKSEVRQALLSASAPEHVFEIFAEIESTFLAR